MRGILSDWAPVMVLVAALVASYVTRRNAADTTALSGFTDLATELREELRDAKKDLAKAKTRIEHLEDEDQRKSNLARVHTGWDYMLLDDFRRHNPDSIVPDPPPLD